jgi:hypothetical protein
MALDPNSRIVDGLCADSAASLKKVSVAHLFVAPMELSI